MTIPRTVKSAWDGAERRLGFFETNIGKVMLAVGTPVTVGVVAFLVAGFDSKFDHKVAENAVIKQMAEAVAKNAEIQAETGRAATENKRNVADLLRQTGVWQEQTQRLQEVQRLLQQDIAVLQTREQDRDRRIDALERIRR